MGYLPRLHANVVEELGELGIESIRDIPDDFPLTEKQRRACTSVQTGEPWFSPDLSEALAALKYPLYFMDFERVNPAVPRFQSMKPYDQIPFQWSVHVLKEPGAETEHFEFLAMDTCCRSITRDGSWAGYEVIVDETDILHGRASPLVIRDKNRMR